MNKELIKKRFGRKLSVYDDNAKIQKQMAERLLSFLSDNGYDRILEIGCGTGILTQAAVNMLNYRYYLANDIVSECESYVKNVRTDINFIGGDIENLVKNTDNKYDLILSNASFQWVEDFPNFIESLLKMLNPNGVLLFSTFGRENYREINFVLGKTLNYYTKNELEQLFGKHSVVVEEEVRVLSFKTPKEVLKHIQNTGVNAISSEVWTKKDLAEFENGYNNFCANHPTLTYNPIYVKILG